MQRDNRVIDPRTFAENVRALLTENVKRYRYFGIYWFFVKELLKRFHDRNQMPILGDYSDPTVSARIPDDVRLSLASMLDAATHEYIQNSTFNGGNVTVEDDDGERFMLADPDVMPS